MTIDERDGRLRELTGSGAGGVAAALNAVVRRAGPGVGVVLVSVALGLTMGRIDSIIIPAVIVVAGGVALAVQAPRTVCLATLLFLPFAGLLRRVTGSYTAAVDPLTLAGPALAAVCVLVLSLRDGSRPRSPLSAAVGAMLGVGMLQILNPAQGGPVAGVLGAGLFIGPLVWFYVGGRIGDQATVGTLVMALKVITVVAGLYGVKQVLFGFTGFELAWAASRRETYAALDISGNIRPFSTFASGAEYSYFLLLGAVLFAIGSGSIRRLLRGCVVLAFVVGCFYSGSRTIFVMSIVAVLVVVMIQRIRSLGKALVICTVMGACALLLLRLVPLSSDDSTSSAIRNRTLTGLVRPFDRDSSTLGIHVDSFRRGVTDGLTTPLGHGAASVNLAGAKLGRQSVAAEHDVPNMLLAYGWAGGVIFAVLVLRIYRLLRWCVRKRRRDLLGPGVFILATFGVWFTGELYAASALLWFFIGAIDRISLTEQRSAGDRLGPGLAATH